MQHANRIRAAMKTATVALIVFEALASLAQGNKTYVDPAGAYSVTVPSGWEAQPQQGSPMVSIVHASSKVSVTLGAMKGPLNNTPTPESQLKKLEDQVQQGCQQAKIEERGATKVAGLNGVFVTVHCAGADGGETMRLTAATGPGAVALIITASPGQAYLKELLPLEQIRSSFKILSGPATHPSAFDAPEAGTNRAAHMQTIAAAGEGQMSGGGQGAYRDPQGRFSLAVPAGWNSASNNGNLTLSSGPAWVSVLTGTGSQPADQNRQIVQQIQAQYKDFKLLNEGDFQNNGHPAHGANATGINPKGQRVSVLVVSISAGGGNYLVLISSAPNDQAKAINGAVMQIAQSVRFAGE